MNLWVFSLWFSQINICQRFPWSARGKAAEVDKIQGRKVFGSWTEEAARGTQWAMARGGKSELQVKLAVAAMGMFTAPEPVVNPGPAIWEVKWVTPLETLVAWSGQPGRECSGWDRGMWEKDTAFQGYDNRMGGKQRPSFDFLIF